LDSRAPTLEVDAWRKRYCHTRKGCIKFIWRQATPPHCRVHNLYGLR
jgi:hypothetical protein